MRAVFVTLVALVAATTAASAGGPTVTAASCRSDSAFRQGINEILAGPVSPTRPYTGAHAVRAFRRAGISLSRENDLLELHGSVPDDQLCDFRWYGSVLSVRPAIMYQLYVLSTPATALREQRYHLVAATKNHDRAHLFTRVRGNVLGEVHLPAGSRGAPPPAALKALNRALANL